MRLLFISNFYPPIRSGGYDLQARDVARGLQHRGHVVEVLTSNYGRDQAPSDETGVHRSLHLQADLHYYRPTHFFLGRRGQERANLRTLERLTGELQPDAVVVWGMYGISRTLVARAEQLFPSRVVYYLSDYWPTSDDLHTAYWKLPPRKASMRVPKRLAGTLVSLIQALEGRPELRFSHALCVSAAVRDGLRQAGLPIPATRVVHNGIDSKAFSVQVERAWLTAGSNRVKLLYAGQLVEHKGVHTAIEAMATLAGSPRYDQVRLTILRTSGHPGYERHLHQLVRALRLGERVEFRDTVPREAMPAILREHDVLVFPSIYEEPLALIVHEAMLAGLVVVGTTTGGTKEVLTEGQNGLTFSPGDAAALARQLARLLDSRHDAQRLAEAGRATILAHFTVDRMVDEIEAYLLDVVLHRRRETAPPALAGSDANTLHL